MIHKHTVGSIDTQGVGIIERLFGLRRDTRKAQVFSIIPRNAIM